MSKLDALIKDFNKAHKEEIAARGIARIHTKKLPFSSPRANYMLYGGLPRGRLIEFAGEENGGKTTTALDIVANAQQLFQAEWEEEIAELESIDKPLKAQLARLQYLKDRGPHQIVYADCENTLDEDWASLLGVDTDSLVLLKPQSQSAEQIFEMLLQMIDTGEVGLAVVDSLGVMVSSQAFEKSVEEKTYGGIAAALTLFSKKAQMSCAKTGCTLIGINQMREDINSRFGGTTTTGGKGWKHNCSVRLMFQKGAFVDERGNELKRSVENPAGNLVMISMPKTKVCKPDRKTGFYTLKYNHGVDAISDTVEVALKYGMVMQKGSWFNLVDIETGELMEDENGEIINLQGKPNVIEYLETNPTLYEELKNKVEELIRK